MTAVNKLPGHDRALTEDDLPALRALIQRCLAADGGRPDAASDGFIRGQYLSGPAICRYEADGSLIAAAALSVPGGDQVTAAGAVDPAQRGRGLGRHLLDWTLVAAGGRPVLVGSEMVTGAAERLYSHYGLRQVFGELVMRADLGESPVVASPPAGVVFRPWSDQLAPVFFATYSEAFRDRPGFPGWSQQQWLDWTTADDDFRPDLCLLAVAPGKDAAGFLTVAANWIVQTGVVPRWRQHGLGSALVTATMSATREAGFGTCWLTVAQNNPTATRLYRRCGFVVAGRRGRFAASE
jgi:mycothiol synthase